MYSTKNNSINMKPNLINEFAPKRYYRNHLEFLSNDTMSQLSKVNKHTNNKYIFE